MFCCWGSKQEGIQKMTGNMSIQALHMYEVVSTDLQCWWPMFPLREVNRATEFRICHVAVVL